MTFLNVFPSDISAEGWSKPYTVFNLAWLFCFFVVVRVVFFPLFCFVFLKNVLLRLQKARVMVDE